MFCHIYVLCYGFDLPKASVAFRGYLKETACACEKKIGVCHAKHERAAESPMENLMTLL